MRSVNKVILIGNLTRDPELRQTPNGQTVVTFGVATNREWVTRDGRRQSLSEFHDVVAWANLAEVCQKYLKKSKLVYVEGYLKTRSWDTPEGIKRFKTEIVVQDLIMLDKRGENGDQPDFIPEDMDGGNNYMSDMPLEAPAKPAFKPAPVMPKKEVQPAATQAPTPRVDVKAEKRQSTPVTPSVPAATPTPTPPPAPIKSIGIDDDLGL
jgi:single-strand DNA-binding protein